MSQEHAGRARLNENEESEMGALSPTTYSTAALSAYECFRDHRNEQRRTARDIAVLATVSCSLGNTFKAQIVSCHRGEPASSPKMKLYDRGKCL